MGFWTFGKGYQSRTAYSYMQNFQLAPGQNQLLEILEPNDFKWRVFLVAGSGFFTDAYSIFATNVITPALAYVYWDTLQDSSRNLAINEATLAGSCVGMVVFGHLADRWGRKSLYGIELVIVIVATLGLTQASRGFDQKAMGIYPWILFWRTLLGIGIGAEYPLSALIAAEWSSTQARGRMLAAVFLMQPLGQLAAYAIGLGALIGLSRQRNLDPNEVDHQVAAPVIDVVWRCVIGVGGIPALIAIAARWSIPETPRYLLEIENDQPGALRSARQVYSGSRNTSNENVANGVAAAQVDGERPQASNRAREGRATNDTEGYYAPQMNPEEEGHGAAHGIAKEMGNTEMSAPGIGSNGGADAQSLPDSTTGKENEDESGAGVSKTKKKKIKRPGFWRRQWKVIWTDFWHEWNTTHKGKGFRYVLAGTSICWFLLDICFYGLGLDSPRTIAKLWAASATNATVVQNGMPDWRADLSSPNESIYNALKGDAIRALYTIPISAVLGCVFILVTVNYLPRATLLAWTFFVLGILFAVTGGSLFGVYETSQHSVAISFYAIVLFVFNLGPNTLTFMLPAELFPTKYRGTCYGISAACGKLGAILVQGVVRKAGITDPGTGKKPLAIMLIIFCPLMILGALVAWFWIPEVQEHANPGPNQPDEEASRNTTSRSFIDMLRLNNISLERIALYPTAGHTFGFVDHIRKLFNRPEARSEALVHGGGDGIISRGVPGGGGASRATGAAAAADGSAATTGASGLEDEKRQVESRIIYS